MTRLRHATACLFPLIPLCAIALWGLGCASNGLDIPYAPPLAASGDAPKWQIEVTDARTFSTASDPAPVPSTSHKPIDPAWTQRVFGRQLIDGDLGADVFTVADQDVPGLVRLALVAGLEQAGLAPTSSGASDTPVLHATIEMLWIWRPEFSAMAKLEYRASVRLRGPVSGLEDGIVVKADGSAAGGAFGGDLWKHALQELLEKLEKNTAQAASA